MQQLRDRSGGGRRWASPWLIALVVVVLLGAGGVVYAVTSGSTAPVRCGTGVSCTRGSTAPATELAAHALKLVGTSPASGATGVPPNGTVTLTFSAGVGTGGASPTISPSLAGSWRRSGDKLSFVPDGPLVPGQKYTVAVPGGTGGVRARTGGHLGASESFTFTVAPGSTARLQQLLAQLGYLPLTFNGPAASPRGMATPQPGTLTWRWAGLPAQLTGAWVEGQPNAVTKGAIMMFETQNGLGVDGVAGPQVWTTLLADVASHKTDTEPWTYVLVTKDLPQHLTAWVNGALSFHDIPVNTGVPGATTRNGIFQVFEHVKFSDMKGTNVTGSKYTDPNVPWASYFNGGDALHGFPRATYGWPQSNGCVEMRITTAGRLWPYTPIGTVVTVQGPTTPAPPPTTTTTAPPATTTTTTSTTAPAG